MSNERNALRYGSLQDMQAILEERPPVDMDEVRAALMNLIDIARINEQQRDRLEARLLQAFPEYS